MALADLVLDDDLVPTRVDELETHLGVEPGNHRGILLPARHALRLQPPVANHQSGAPRTGKDDKPGDDG